MKRRDFLKSPVGLGAALLALAVVPDRTSQPEPPLVLSGNDNKFAQMRSAHAKMHIRLPYGEKWWEDSAFRVGEVPITVVRVGM